MGLFLLLGSAAGLLLEVRELLRPAGARGERVWRVTVFATLAAALPASIASIVLFDLYPAPGLPLASLGDHAWTLSFSVFVFSFAAAPVVFAWLHLHLPVEDPRRKRQALLLSAGLALWPA